MIYMMSEVRSVTFDEMVDALADIQRRKLMVALLIITRKMIHLRPWGSEIDTLDHLVSMNHVHLPKLANYGFIEWDEANHEVSKGPNFDEIRPLLELLATHEDELPADWL